MVTRKSRNKLFSLKQIIVFLIIKLYGSKRDSSLHYSDNLSALSITLPPFLLLLPALGLPTFQFSRYVDVHDYIYSFERLSKGRDVRTLSARAILIIFLRPSCALDRSLHIYAYAPI